MPAVPVGNRVLRFHGGLMGSAFSVPSAGVCDNTVFAVSVISLLCNFTLGHLVISSPAYRPAPVYMSNIPTVYRGTGIFQERTHCFWHQLEEEPISEMPQRKQLAFLSAKSGAIL